MYLQINMYKMFRIMCQFAVECLIFYGDVNGAEVRRYGSRCVFIIFT